MVAVGTLVSAFWILSVNSWMHTPAGYGLNEAGQFIPADWLKIIFNPSFPYRLVHMTFAAYLTTARPPRSEPCKKRLRVVLGGLTLADTMHGKRVLETSHPPVYYFPAADIRMHYLLAVSGSSFCEWKGTAHYFDVNVAGRLVGRAAWAYSRPGA